MIPIQNIYYMLSYAFRELSEREYKQLGSESFENALDLLTSILNISVKKLIKRGLGRDYQLNTDELSTLRGKIDLTQSIKNRSFLNNRLVCNYDEFSIDNYLNRIIKTTYELLLKTDINKCQKKDIKRTLLYFKNVKTLKPKNINWNYRVSKNNSHYRLILFVCNLIIEGLIQNENGNEKSFKEYLDNQRMNRLYEKFLLEYFKIEHPEFKVSAKQIKWSLDNSNSSFLPVMQSDVFIEYNNKILIIDAKYYQKTMQSYYDVRTIHSNNIYQIFTYVKNQSANTSTDVSGMLLYAGTDEEIQPNETFLLDGNKISIKALDLNTDFQKIKEQLENIAETLKMSK